MMRRVTICDKESECCICETGQVTEAKVLLNWIDVDCGDSVGDCNDGVVFGLCLLRVQA